MRLVKVTSADSSGHEKYSFCSIVRFLYDLRFLSEQLHIEIRGISKVSHRYRREGSDRHGET